MPAVLSKQFFRQLLGLEWSFGYNCYEVGHHWTPNCAEASLDISMTAALKVVPLYALLYGFTQLVSARNKLAIDTSLETIKSIVRSTCFIFFHAYTGISMGCTFRNLMGRFYYRVLVFFPAFVSSLLSLLIEHPSRRYTLAFYMLNMASEIAYRLLLDKHYIRRSIPHGETLLFALSMAGWLCFVRQHGYGRDLTSQVLRLLMGSHEAAPSRHSHIHTHAYINPQAPTQNDSHTNISALENAHETHEKHSANHHHQYRTTRDVKSSSWLVKSQAQLQELSDKLTFFIRSTLKQLVGARMPQYLVPGSHVSCPHSKENSSCLEYVALSVPSRFLLGYIIQAALKLTSRPLFLLAHPLEATRTALASPANVRFSAFLASLVAVTRLTSCSLRRWSNDHHNWHALMAGFAGGLSMLWAPRSSISLYVMWKFVEQYYLQAAREGKVKYKDATVVIVYSLSCSFILYCFALEPKLIRAPFMKFIDNISDHRLHQLNRMVLDIFSAQASAGYEQWFPDLDPKYMTPQFKECVFNWMIADYK